MEYLKQVLDTFTDNFDPEFFYKPEPIIDKLENAIRIKSGLSIVTGETGTGKSALCNYLNNRLYIRNEDDKILTFIIKEPYCISIAEFILRIAEAFELEQVKDKKIEQLKILIRNFIVKKTNEGFLLVLMIDDGQQLQHFCLEYLSELLNLEASGEKLLQIVIFGQSGLEQRLIAIHGLYQRIREHCRLNPLGFKETRELISLRIKVASNNFKLPRLFTYMGIAAIFQATSGNQKKIIDLCHKVLISMSTNKKRHAGWFHIRNLTNINNRSNSAKKVKNVKQNYALATVFLLSVIILLIGKFTPFSSVEAKNSTQPTVTINKPMEIIIPEKTPSTTEDNQITYKKISMTEIPSDSHIEPNEIMGILTEETDMSVWSKIGILFNNKVNREFVNRLIAINSQIHDFNHLKSGDFLKIPFVPSTCDAYTDKKLHIKIQSFDTLDGAIEYVAEYPDNFPSIKIFPYINKINKKVYDIMLEENFNTKDDADNFINNELAGQYANSAQIIDKIDDMTYCYKIWVD
ncbi:MAG: AAA family ATPase [Nitrospirae bacterium]|nr:AAA family ATPase [Nitrospirota bacterium]